MAIKFAKNLASSLQYVGIRRFVKKEVLRQFDGDYNFLFATNVNKSVSITTSDGRTAKYRFKDVLFGIDSENTRNSSTAFLDSLSALYPLLQIAMPELQAASAETWNDEREIPLVAVLPENIDGASTVNAYTPEGKVVQLSIDKEPENLVIVISGNERLTGVPKNDAARTAICTIEQEPYYSTETTDFYLTESYYEEVNRCIIAGNGNDSGNTGNNCVGCDRDCKITKDELVKMKFKDIGALRAAESWLAGKLEVEAIIIVGNKNPNGFYELRKTAYGKRNQFRECKFLGKCETKWYYMNTEILTWDKSELGDKMKYQWYEVDDSPMEKVKLSATVKIGSASVTGSVEVGIKKKRTDLGDSYVEYCDPANSPGTQYNPGSVLFYVKQR